MTDFSLKQIVLFDQELVALSRIIEISFEAFKVIDYPEYYEFFLKAIVQIVQFGSMAVTQASPWVAEHQFAGEADKISTFLREVSHLGS